ncbi:Mor transcription activator family protein [Paraburkholderia unamae]|uniref:Mor transcription activator family protein n=1 Tax=Paraburkholderia unamae TaxID=219649 RepID=A0ABX5KHV2_9BURK|nr:Mor transcription activator family protein [Paraburkholderia unamae]PVX80034.1 Mor transcription activator family protein [Paraburkholderia unamae]
MRLDNVKHLLPDVVQVLVRLIGLPAAVRLVEQLGGTTFPVALRKSRLGEIRYEALSEIVGGEAADAITQHFGGDMLYIPKCEAAARELLYREIRADFDGITREHSALHAVAELAKKYRLSDRHVWRILKKHDDDGGTPTEQGALF